MLYCMVARFIKELVAFLVKETHHRAIQLLLHVLDASSTSGSKLEACDVFGKLINCTIINVFSREQKVLFGQRKQQLKHQRFFS